MTENPAPSLPPLLIPAFRPEEKLISLVHQLLQDPYPLIVVVDDGSGEEKRKIFEALKLDRVVVLTHEHNKGKGGALKTGMQFIFEQKKYPGVVTVDADGQHLAPDVLKVAQALLTNPDRLILGCRQFGPQVPLRSQFGNILTKHIFGLFVGQTVSDTQTGLRGIPISFIPDLLGLKTGRYEFELDMLIKAASMHLSYLEVPITTVYENDNKGSHFNPIVDSLRIYFVFFRFTFSSILTAVLDFVVFALVHHFSGSTAVSITCSRTVAASFNFLFVRLVVFKHQGNVLWSATKFLALVILMGSISLRLIESLVVHLQWNVLVAKVSVETFLFLMNFTVQRLFVFNRKIRKKH